MNGHAGTHRVRGFEAAFGDLVGSGDRPAAATGAAHRAEEHVFLTPHHTLRHPGRAAGVEDVEIVGGAGTERAIRARVRQRSLVVERTQRFGYGRGAVVDRDEHLQIRECRSDGEELRRELPMEHDGTHVGVVEEIAQLVFDVAVVHVDRDGAQLERRDHDFEVLVGVVEVTGDVIARADSLRGERVGQPGRSDVGFREGQVAIRADECLVIGHGVGHPFPEIREVELHRR